MKKIAPIILFAFLFRFVLAFTTWHIDVANHMDWGIRFWQYEANKIYAPESNIWSFTWPNQPPGTMLIFALIRKLYEFVFSIFWMLNVKIPVFPSVIIPFIAERLYPAMLKLPAILADLGIGWLIYLIIRYCRDFSTIRGVKASQAQLATSEVFYPEMVGLILWLFNPVVWYNSSVWGQTDSVINFLVLLAIYLLFRRKLFWAIFSIVLCFYVKASLLIFAPLFVIITLRQKYKLSMHVHSLLVTLMIIGGVTLLFSYPKEPYLWLINLYRDKILGSQMQVITANALNFWGMVKGLHEIPHSLMLGFWSYKTWGWVLFTISYLPVLYLVYKKQDLITILEVMVLAAFSSFMLLTNMHERYLYPLFPALTILVMLNTKLLKYYLALSLINLLNLYNLWWVPRIEILYNLMTVRDFLFPRILSLVSVIIYVVIYLQLSDYFRPTIRANSSPS